MLLPVLLGLRPPELVFGFPKLALQILGFKQILAVHGPGLGQFIDLPDGLLVEVGLVGRGAFRHPSPSHSWRTEQRYFLDPRSRNRYHEG